MAYALGGFWRSPTVPHVGVVQLNQIKTRISTTCGPLVDVSDVTGDVDVARLTRGLTAWVLTQAAATSNEDAAAAVTDGFGDNGIDAILIDTDSSIVYLVQSKWNAKGTGSPALGDVHKFIQGFRDIINAQFDRFNAKVQAKQLELEQALSDPNVKFVLIVAHSGSEPMSDIAHQAIADVLAEINDPIDTASFKMLTQTELHGFLTKDAKGTKPDLDVTLFDWGGVDDPYSAIYGQADATAVASWFADYGPQLFVENLRLYLGSNSDVNASIVDTLVNSPQHFWYLNNGITVLCDRFGKKPLAGGNKKTGYFSFTGVSVVNGAQTVGCIGKAVNDHPEAVADARVSVRFISLENCPEGFGAEVTRGNNTQNRVERRDFVALDSQQIRLVTELAIDGIVYAIKSGEPAPDPAHGCTVVDATVALACANPSSDLAVSAKATIGRLWAGAENPSSNSSYEQLFNSAVTSSKLWRAVRVLRVIDAALHDERQKLDGRDKMIGIHGNRLMAHIVYQQLPADLLTLAAEPEFIAALASIPEVVRRVYPATIQVINEDYPANYLASLFKNASRCKDLASRATEVVADKSGG